MEIVVAGQRREAKRSLAERSVHTDGAAVEHRRPS